jgi:hypothetical protein
MKQSVPIGKGIFKNTRTNSLSVVVIHLYRCTQRDVGAPLDAVQVEDNPGSARTSVTNDDRVVP